MPLGPGLSALRRPFDYSGRATRTEALSFTLTTRVIQFAFTAVVTVHFAQGDIALTPVIGLWELLFLPFWLALLARRSHDQGRSGWWLSLTFAGVFLFAALAGLMPQAPAGGYSVTLYFWRFRPEPGLLMTLHAIAGILGFPVASFMVFGEGEQGPNRYGRDPRAAAPEPDATAPA